MLTYRSYRSYLGAWESDKVSRHSNCVEKEGRHWDSGEKKYRAAWSSKINASWPKHRRSVPALKLGGRWMMFNSVDFY
jgi:hypothetical protein